MDPEFITSAKSVLYGTIGESEFRFAWDSEISWLALSRELKSLKTRGIEQGRVGPRLGMPRQNHTWDERSFYSFWRQYNCERDNHEPPDFFPFITDPMPYTAPAAPNAQKAR